jgi:hypothetical protein
VHCQLEDRKKHDQAGWQQWQQWQQGKRAHLLQQSQHDKLRLQDNWQQVQLVPAAAPLWVLPQEGEQPPVPMGGALEAPIPPRRRHVMIDDLILCGRRYQGPLSGPVWCGAGFKTEAEAMVHRGLPHEAAPTPKTADGQCICMWDSCQLTTAPGKDMDEHLLVHLQTQEDELAQQATACCWEGPDGSKCETAVAASEKPSVFSQHVKAHVLSASASVDTFDLPAECSWSGCRHQLSGEPARDLKHARVHFSSDKNSKRGCKWKGCLNVAPNFTSAKGHIWLHSLFKRHVCQTDACAKRFANLRTLREHQRSCPPDSIVVAAAKRKRRAAPTMKHPCTWPGCNKSLAAGSTMKRHFRTHTNEKPLCCTVAGCEYRAAAPASVAYHQRKVHPPSTNAPSTTAPLTNAPLTNL